MNLVITGMRGTGKTTIGELLAAKLGRKFIDLDQYIEDNNGKIQDLVEEHGWTHFRELEKKATQEVSEMDNLVIATGGGTFIDPENASALKENGFVLLLTANTKTLANRIGFDPNRPALTDQGSLEAELEQIWTERQDIYLENADLTCDTSEDLDPSSSVDKIVEILPIE